MPSRNVRVGGGVQQLGVIVVCAEVLSLVPGTLIRQLTTVTPIPENPVPSSGTRYVYDAQTFTQTKMPVHTSQSFYF